MGKLCSFCKERALFGLRDAKIIETRGVLDELESAARAVREKRQHEMVEHLDELFPEAELTPGKLGSFKEEVMAEWREFIVRLKKYVGRDLVK